MEEWYTEPAKRGKKVTPLSERKICRGEQIRNPKTGECIKCRDQQGDKVTILKDDLIRYARALNINYLTDAYPSWQICGLIKKRLRDIPDGQNKLHLYVKDPDLFVKDWTKAQQGTYSVGKGATPPFYGETASFIYEPKIKLFGELRKNRQVMTIVDKVNMFQGSPKIETAQGKLITGVENLVKYIYSAGYSLKIVNEGKEQEVRYDVPIKLAKSDDSVVREKQWMFNIWNPRTREKIGNFTFGYEVKGVKEEEEVLGVSDILEKMGIGSASFSPQKTSPFESSPAKYQSSGPCKQEKIWQIVEKFLSLDDWENYFEKETKYMDKKYVELTREARKLYISNFYQHDVLRKFLCDLDHDFDIDDAKREMNKAVNGTKPFVLKKPLSTPREEYDQFIIITDVKGVEIVLDKKKKEGEVTGLNEKKARFKFMEYMLQRGEHAAALFTESSNVFTYIGPLFFMGKERIMFYQFQLEPRDSYVRVERGTDSTPFVIIGKDNVYLVQLAKYAPKEIYNNLMKQGKTGLAFLLQGAKTVNIVSHINMGV